MKTLKCLIVEDEPIAAGIVQSYIAQIGFLQLEAVCSNALSALEVLREKKIDVMFLDIHLPGLKGIDFARSLASPPKIIITSAYDHYALDGFELEITDYLLKPFPFQRFLKAISRVQTSFEKQLALPDGREHRFFNVNKKMVKVYLDEILYIESLKEYVRISTLKKSIVTKFQIGELENIFNHHDFLRVHRSFLVSKSKVDSFTSDTVEIGGKLIPIGRSFSDPVKKELQNL